MTRNLRSSLHSSRLRVDPLVAGLAVLAIGWCIVSFLPVFRNWLTGDVRFYENWGNWTTTHRTPYKDFSLEYPPGALLPFAVPVYLRKLAGYHWGYTHWFRVEVLVFWAAMLGAMAWALRSLGASRRQSIVALVFGGGALLLLGPIAVSRYDVWPALFTAVAVAALVSGRGVLACAAIAAGFVAKIYPIVLLPIALVVLWRARGRRGVVEGVGAALLVSLAGFGPFLVLAPHGLWHGLWRQASRPLQVESLGASFFALAHQFGLHVHAVKSYGSDNLATHGADVVATLSSVALVLALLLVWIVFARSANTPETIVLACAAAVTAYVAFAKVFSPQYLVWLVPLVPLVRRTSLTVLLAVVAGVTQLWEPYRYFAFYTHFAPYESTLVLVRDLLVVALLVLLVRPLRRHAEQLDAARAPALG
jgi:uncharacterized membrane protein